MTRALARRWLGGGGGNRARQPAALLLVLLILMTTLLSTAPPAHAASSIVQQNSAINDAGLPTSLISVTLPARVTAGDVLAVAVDNGFNGVQSKVTDTLGSSFTFAVGMSDNGVTAYIATATLSSSGSDTVNVSFVNYPTDRGVVFVYEVSGVTTSGAATATGNGHACKVIGYCNHPISTYPSTSFSSGAFLLATIFDNSAAAPPTPGNGFTLSNFPTFWQAFAEYSVSGVSSPTDFPASVTDYQAGWIEAGIALHPASSTTTTVNCFPPSLSASSVSTCAATVTGSSPTGTITFTSSSGTGVFNPATGQCTLSSGACSVAYSDTAGGAPTITASFSGDFNNSPSSGTFHLTVSSPSGTGSADATILQELGTFAGTNTVSSMLSGIQQELGNFRPHDTVADLLYGIQRSIGGLDNDLIHISVSLGTFAGTNTVSSMLSGIQSSASDLQTKVSSIQSQLAKGTQQASGSGETTLTPSSSMLTLFTNANNKVGTVTVSLGTSGFSKGSGDNGVGNNDNNNKSDHKSSLVIVYYTDPGKPTASIQKTVTADTDIAGFTDTAAAWQVKIIATFPHSGGSATVTWAYSAIYPSA